MNKLPSFILFITVFLTIYGLLHFYFYRKFTRAIDIGIMPHILLIVVLCFLLLSPIIINISAKTVPFLLTAILAHTGYIWMGALFLFFSVNLIIDIYRLIIHISARVFSSALIRYLPGEKITLIITLLIVACIIVYGRFEAGNIAVEKIKLRTTKLPPQLNTLRLVQISDIHFSTINGLKLAQKIKRKIVELQPDILISTGDMIDSGLQDKELTASAFREIKTKYGNYATTGNHEFISGIKEAVEFIEKAGFRMLRNESVTISGFLNISAIDDPAAKRFGTASDISEEQVLKTSSPDNLNIFLKHQPRIQNNSLGKFDLQLSGHTHKGQIFPFTLITSLFYPHQSGLFKLENGSSLYVSRGTGTWGPPVRFLAVPEITVIDFQTVSP
ncbi:metallophosphoesterase [Thermodesulfobacteriota bacterium]